VLVYWNQLVEYNCDLCQAWISRGHKFLSTGLVSPTCFIFVVFCPLPLALLTRNTLCYRIILVCPIYYTESKFMPYYNTQKRKVTRQQSYILNNMLFNLTDIEFCVQMESWSPMWKIQWWPGVPTSLFLKIQ
jgi:hypothetical protein